jgi:hypothetical protein
MKITVRIDDDLLRDLKEQAHREGTSLGRLVNRLLRLGMAASSKADKAARPYREKTHAMGEPKVNLDKALALAAALEDDEVIQKLARTLHEDH